MGKIFSLFISEHQVECNKKIKKSVIGTLSVVYYFIFLFKYNVHILKH